MFFFERNQGTQPHPNLTGGKNTHQLSCSTMCCHLRHCFEVRKLHHRAGIKLNSGFSLDSPWRKCPWSMCAGLAGATCPKHQHPPSKGNQCHFFQRKCCNGQSFCIQPFSSKCSNGQQLNTKQAWTFGQIDQGGTEKSGARTCIFDHHKKTPGAAAMVPPSVSPLIVTPPPSLSRCCFGHPTAGQSTGQCKEKAFFSQQTIPGKTSGGAESKQPSASPLQPKLGWTSIGTFRSITEATWRKGIGRISC